MKRTRYARSEIFNLTQLAHGRLKEATQAAPECYRHPPLETFAEFGRKQGHVPDEREEGEARQLSL